MPSIDDKFEELENNVSNAGLEIIGIKLQKTGWFSKREKIVLEVIGNRNFYQTSYVPTLEEAKKGATIIQSEYDAGLEREYKIYKDAGIVLIMLNKIFGSGKSRVIPSNEPGVLRKDLMRIEYQPYDNSALQGLQKIDKTLSSKYKPEREVKVVEIAKYRWLFFPFEYIHLFL